jgi:long-chain acyl-CoA synthetase
MVPTMIRRILELDDELHERWPTPELRAIISGAAPFPDALRRRAIERFGAERIFDFYGATELGWVTTIRGDEMLEREGSVGRPLPGQTIRITDEEGRELPAAEVGIIRIRGEQSMRGYLRDEEATRASGLGDDDAWVTVEDMGYVDEDGYLYLAGRARDMVISGGVNIYPAEIEEAYGHHEAIADIAVVGVPHEEWGEELVGFVVPREDTDPPQTESLEDWGRERLASYKIPRSWVFVDELPRNPTGKVLKNELRERYEKSPESS